jgi:CSLREA domain-containing protein
VFQPRPRFGARLALMLFALVVLPDLKPAPARAARTFTVNTGADTSVGGGCLSKAACSLRDAILAANATAGPDIILLPARTYQLQGDLPAIGDALTISGALSSTTIIDGQIETYDLQPFRIAPKITVAISGTTIRNTASPTASIILNQGDLTVVNSTFSNNLVVAPSGKPAGIILNQGRLLVLRSLFKSNSTSVSSEGACPNCGSAIWNSGAATVVASTFTKNIINSGGVGSDGTLTVRDSLIFDNYGGGIVQRGGSAVISNTVIVSNTRSDQGGGVYGEEAAITIVDSLISGNRVQSGDVSFGGGVAVAAYSNFDRGSLLIRNTTIVSNSAVDGGGVSVEGYKTVTLSNTRILSNTAEGSGGGLFGRLSAITVTDSLIGGNRSVHNGGGLFVSDFGGDIDLDSFLLVHNSQIVRNTSGADGGGISLYRFYRGLYAFHSTVRILGSSILSNTAVIGAGVFNIFGLGLSAPQDTITVAASLIIADSTLSGNQASEGGGGLFSTVDVSPDKLSSFMTLTHTLMLRNSTISGNSAPEGGGVYDLSNYAGASDVTGLFAMYNTTISGNRATERGGGLVAASNTGTVRMANSILAGNAAPTSADCYGEFHSQGYNLIQSTAGCAISGTTTGNLSGISPRLGPLANNGGATSSHALLAGSPAIDAGNPVGCRDQANAPLTSDQRGRARPQDGDEDGAAHCDIGAFELGPPATPQAYVPVLVRR